MSERGWTQLTSVQSLYLLGIGLFSGSYILGRWLVQTYIDLEAPRYRLNREVLLLGRGITVALVIGVLVLVAAAAWMQRSVHAGGPPLREITGVAGPVYAA